MGGLYFATEVNTASFVSDLRKTDAGVVAFASPPAFAGAGQALVLSSAPRLASAILRKSYHLVVKMGTIFDQFVQSEPY